MTPTEAPDTGCPDHETAAGAIWLWLVVSLLKWVPPALLAAYLASRALTAIGVAQ